MPGRWASGCRDRIDAQLLARLLAHDHTRPSQPRFCTRSWSPRCSSAERSCHPSAAVLQSAAWTRSVPEEPDQAPGGGHRADRATPEDARQGTGLAVGSGAVALDPRCRPADGAGARRGLLQRPLQPPGPVHRLPQPRCAQQDSGSSRDAKLSRCAAQRLRVVVQRSHVQQPGRPYFHETHLALQARGLARTQSLVVVGRKIARIAFALLKNQQRFTHHRSLTAGGQTRDGDRVTVLRPNELAPSSCAFCSHPYLQTTPAQPGKATPSSRCEDHALGSVRGRPLPQVRLSQRCCVGQAGLNSGMFRSSCSSQVTCTRWPHARSRVGSFTPTTLESIRGPSSRSIQATA